MAQRLSRQEVDNLKPEQVHGTLGRTMLVDGFPVVFDLDKSQGMYLVDAKTGKEYLDFFGHFASAPITCNHPKLNTPEFKKLLGEIAVHNPANSDVYTLEMAKFVATFERVVMPKEFKHLFFVAGGGLAVENALKAAFDWKVRLNMSRGKGELGSKVLHFKQAFHGRTGYTLSLTNTSDPRKYQYFPLFDWPRVSNPKAHFPLEGGNLKDTIAAEERSLKEIREILTKDSTDIAAIILEPLQGEGGDNHFRPEFWQELRKLADEFEVMLIADEVQSGMGASGKTWFYEHYGAVPDMVCFGKKSQVCGFMSTDRIDSVKDNVFAVSSRINSTWGGNLTDMVRSRRYLEIIEEDNLIANAAEVGEHLLNNLAKVSAKHRGLISNVRGKGLLVAFDLPSGEARDKCVEIGFEKNLILLPCGDNSIRIRPPLDCPKEAVDKLLELLDPVFASLAQSRI